MQSDKAITWMNGDGVWHEIDISSQGEATVRGYDFQTFPFSCKIERFSHSGSFFGVFNSLWSSSLSDGFSEEGASVSCQWLGAAHGVKCLSAWKCRWTGCNACRGDASAAGAMMCWGWAFCAAASGVCLVPLKVLTSPPPLLFANSFICRATELL